MEECEKNNNAEIDDRVNRKGRSLACQKGRRTKTKAQLSEKTVMEAWIGQCDDVNVSSLKGSRLAEIFQVVDAI